MRCADETGTAAGRGSHPSAQREGRTVSDAELLAFVKASAALQGLRLDERHTEAVAGHMAVLAGMARLLDAADLQPEDELAQIYCPAPFPLPPAGEQAR